MNQIGMPFSANNWPSITKITPCVECRDKKQHRLYKAIGIPCPCGPCVMTASDISGAETRFFGDDIIIYKDHKEAFRLSDLFKRLTQLEQEVKDLKNGK